MIIKNWLEDNTKYLIDSSVATARLDCLVLLEDVTGKDRSWLLAHADSVIPAQKLKKLNNQLQRRFKHEPLAYIRGFSEFYGRKFMVTPNTLEPRPDTETMIDLLHSHFPSLLKVRPFTDGGNVNGTIVDVGTGSGCLAITSKLVFPKAEVIGTDISKECLEVAKQNSEKLNADVKFYQGDLLEALPSSIFDIPTSSLVILANLPYVPDTHTINESAMHEPKLAIFGGTDGLDLYKNLFEQIDSLELKPKLVFTESLPFQHIGLVNIANGSHYELVESDDFIQVFKYSANL